MNDERELDGDDPDRVLDALLDERGAPGAGPDLTEAVLARLARGDARSVASRLRFQRVDGVRRRSPWLAAAVLLFGLGIVFGVVLARGEESSSSQQPVSQDPKPTPDAKEPVVQDPAKDLPVAFTLRVVDPNGAPVPRMAVQLLRVVRGGPAVFHYTHVTGFDELRRAASKAGTTPSASVRETAPNEREVRGRWSDGEYAVEVESELHARTRSQPFTIENGKPPPMVHVTMTPCIEVRLQLATLHGKPVGGAVVTTIPNRADPRTDYLEPAGVRGVKLLSELRVESDGSGVAVLRPMAEGRYFARVEHPNFCTVVVGPFDVPMHEPLDVVRMLRGTRVRGSVVGAKEAIATAGLELRPVDDAVVVEPGTKPLLRPRSDSMPGSAVWPMSTTADANGAFEFSGRVPPGTYVLTPVYGSDRDSLRTGASDSIEVVVEEGKDDLEVTIACSAEPSNPKQPVSQDPKPAPDAKEPVVQDPAKDLPVAFTLRVVDPSGAPVPRMAVHLLSSLGTQPPRYSTLYVHDELHDRTGTLFAIHDIAVRQANAEEREFRCRLNPHSYVVTVESEGYAKTVSRPFTVQKGAPAPLVDVVMNPGVEMRLQIATEHGKPIGGAVVTTVETPPEAMEVQSTPRIEDSAALRSEVRAESDGSGTVVLRHMAEGCYTLRVEHPDFCSAELASVLVPLPEPIDVVRLVPGTVIRGTVRGVKGVVANQALTLTPRAPARLTQGLRVPARIRVMALPRTGWHAMSAKTDADGTFAFRHRVPEGTYVLSTPTEVRFTESGVVDPSRTESEWKDVVVEAGKEEVVVEWEMRDR